MGVWFIGNAAGYVLTGILGALLPPTGDKLKDAAKLGINLQGIPRQKVQPTAQQLAIMAENKISDYLSYVRRIYHP
jgi:POT family proton-dependent oligopeptide transporter